MSKLLIANDTGSKDLIQPLQRMGVPAEPANLDFGDIVFNLIEHSVFSKTDNDRREDFADLFDFDEAFVKPFQPARRSAGPSAAGAFGTA